MGKQFSQEATFEVEIPNKKNVRIVANQKTGDVLVEGTNEATMKFPLHIKTERYQEADGALYVRVEQNGMGDIEVGFTLTGDNFARGELVGPIMKVWTVKKSFRGTYNKVVAPGVHFSVGPDPLAGKNEIRLISFPEFASAAP